MFALPYIFGFASRLRSRLPHSLAMKHQTKSGRPPNILIYTGKDEHNSDKFQKTKELLQQCLHQDKYVIYQLKHDLVLQEPWKENTELLLLTSDHVLDKSRVDAFEIYIRDGGKLLDFSKFYSLNDSVRLRDVSSSVKEICLSKTLGIHEQNLHFAGIDTIYEVEKQENVKVLAASAQTSQAVVVSVSHGDGIAVLSTAQISPDVTEDRLENGSKELLKILLNFLGMSCGDTKQSLLTNAYLLGDDKEKEVFLKSIQDVLVNNCFKGNSINILFTENTPGITISNENFPVVTNAKKEDVLFDFSLYKEHLTTKHLGQLVIYTDIITSTQTILNESLKLVRKLPEGFGVVLLARQQTVGKGRGSNAWLSPDGCLSFSFALHVGLDSNLGQRLPFVQHIAALAVVDAVRGMNGYEDIDMQIKWPNDIYSGKHTKIGGVLINSSIQGRSLYAVIGIGVNLDNNEPTTCINEMIEQQSVQSKLALKKLSREQLLARILCKMEHLVEDFQNAGPGGFLEKYYLRWLHSDVKVNLGENGETVIIKGLDDMGFLSVRNSLNEVRSVQPDGNSFDMMRNLIIMKTRN